MAANWGQVEGLGVVALHPHLVFDPHGVGIGDQNEINYWILVPNVLNYSLLCDLRELVLKVD